jgi:hypothetical protein
MIQKCQDRTFTRKTALKCHDMAPAIKLQCSNQNLDSSIAASNPLQALNDNERNWSKSVKTEMVFTFKWKVDLTPKTVKDF